MKRKNSTFTYFYSLSNHKRVRRLSKRRCDPNCILICVTDYIWWLLNKRSIVDRYFASKCNRSIIWFQCA